MKLCPACSRLYDDDKLKFCLDDGSNLVDKVPATPAPSTLVLPSSESPVPTMKQVFQPAVPAGATVGGPVNKKRSVLPWVLGAAGLLLLGSSIVLGVFLLRPKSSLRWHLIMEIDQATPNREAAVKETIKVLEKRLDAYGVSRVEILPQGDGRILLNLPGVKDPERLKQLIIQNGNLELVHVVGPPSPQAVQIYFTKEEAKASIVGGTGSASLQVVPYRDRDQTPANSDPADKKWVVVEIPPIVNGKDLSDARAARSPYGGTDNYQIQFSLNPAGADKFGAWTAANINNYLGIMLNDEVKSIAYIKSQITDSGEISGRFTKQSAEDLALILRTGALPAPVKFVSETTDQQ